MCGKCHTRKQVWKDLPRPDGNGTFRHLAVVMCKCEEDKERQEKTSTKNEGFKNWVTEMKDQYGISDMTYQKFTFADDDRRTAKISDVCRRYVEKWDEMKKDNMGVLFYGSVGTGKSFYACAIVNALIEKRVPATVTNFPRLLNILQNANERQKYIDHLQAYHLLVIDDLGVERDTPYAAEIVYSVIDARARSGLPLIVTTNLTMEELKTPTSMQFARIYDRVLDLCPITLKMTGDSRRAGNAELRRQKAKEILMEE